MLKLEVETLDGVDESLHSFYEQSDTGYKLKVDGLEDTSGLKTALQKERESNKEAKGKLTQLEKEREEAEKKILDQGKFKDLSERERNEKLQAQKDLQELKARIADAKSSSMIKDFALSMTTDKDEIDIISRFAKDYIAVDGEEVSFGKPLEEIKAELGRFVRSKASDHADNGNSKGGGNAKTMTRAQHKELDPASQAKFFRDGGSLTD